MLWTFEGKINFIFLLWITIKFFIYFSVLNWEKRFEKIWIIQRITFNKTWRIVKKTWRIVKKTWRTGKNKWRTGKNKWRIVKNKWRTGKNKWRTGKNKWRIVKNKWRTGKGGWGTVKKTTRARCDYFTRSFTFYSTESSPNRIRIFCEFLFWKNYLKVSISRGYHQSSQKFHPLVFREQND